MDHVEHVLIVGTSMPIQIAWRICGEDRELAAWSQVSEHIAAVCKTVGSDDMAPSAVADGSAVPRADRSRCPRPPRAHLGHMGTRAGMNWPEVLRTEIADQRRCPKDRQVARLPDPVHQLSVKQRAPELFRRANRIGGALPIVTAPRARCITLSNQDGARIRSNY